MTERQPDPADSPRPHRSNAQASPALFPLVMLAVGVRVLALFKSLDG